MARQDSQFMSQTSHAAAQARSGSGAGLFVLCLGLALTAFGIVLAVGPQYSGRIAKVAEQVTGYGIQYGLLVVPHLRFSLWLVACVSTDVSNPADFPRESNISHSRARNCSQPVLSASVP